MISVYGKILVLAAPLSAAIRLSVVITAGRDVVEGNSVRVEQLADYLL